MQKYRSIRFSPKTPFIKSSLPFFLMRHETIKKYVDKYSIGVIDIQNSLENYNSFFTNMGFSESIEELIEKKLEEKVFVKVMDLGCGNGGFLADLKKKFDESVHTIGADLLAPENEPDELVLGDALEQPFPKDVDFIFSFRSLHEIGEPEKLIKKIYESLADGGKAFLSFRTADLLKGGKGLAEITEKETKFLKKIVSEGKLSSFSIGGFEVTVKGQNGENITAGVNIFLKK